MTDYIVVVEASPSSPPSAPGSENNELVFTVPPSTQTRSFEQRPEPTRKEHPEEWMVKNVLPKYPDRVVNLYERRTVYEPATHKKRGE